MREVLDPDEFRERADAAHLRFFIDEIEEWEYRSILSKLGLSEVEVNSEVTYRKGIKDDVRDVG